ncbi:MAG: hypothetical protein JXR97_10980 [Planctomycetes bacterium]|nr:hypothetical protein [Planctomycetota bacterium]
MSRDYLALGRAFLLYLRDTGFCRFYGVFCGFYGFWRLTVNLRRPCNDSAARLINVAAACPMNAWLKNPGKMRLSTFTEQRNFYRKKACVFSIFIVNHFYLQWRKGGDGPEVFV